MMNPRVWQHVILCSSFPRTFLLKPNPNDPTSVWRRQRTMLVLTLTALVLCITVHTAECDSNEDDSGERKTSVNHSKHEEQDDKVNHNKHEEQDDKEKHKQKKKTNKPVNHSKHEEQDDKEKHKQKRKTNKPVLEKHNKHEEQDDKGPSAPLLIIAATLAGFGLVMILWKGTVQTQSPKPCITEHHYETIEDTPPAPAPGSEKQCKTVYALADHPAKLKIYPVSHSKHTPV
ncbi:uncharacterized protein LOC128634917 isoform X5 [Ictalurus punctatus]|uniref:Uncharacterized protein LOC128634917 isoform X5 n=1 Tax=Ictalurus punctatus TaxID=7998 RepID=A0A9F7RF80_ICTPU|nr:uncharacterized protein LOC128634917 isoform X5 [Ictalurus punctatus]